MDELLEIPAKVYLSVWVFLYHLARGELQLLWLSWNFSVFLFLFFASQTPSDGKKCPWFFYMVSLLPSREDIHYIFCTPHLTFEYMTKLHIRCHDNVSKDDMLSGARRALRMFLPRMVCNELVHFVAMDKKKNVLEGISDQDSDWETNVLLLHSVGALS